MKTIPGVAACALLLIALTPAAGGWAVITVEDLPEYLVVGQSVPIAFTIRQHGQRPMDDRRPSVTVRDEGSWFIFGRRRTDAMREGSSGRYVTTIMANRPGLARVTIDANFRSARVLLLPVRVVPGGERPEPLSPFERGRELFVASGCVTCHAKRDDPAIRGRLLVQVGPELTGRTFPAEWLAQKLRDPASLRAGPGRGDVMPNLGLPDATVTALVSYVNSVRAEGVAAP